MHVIESIQLTEGRGTAGQSAEHEAVPKTENSVLTICSDVDAGLELSRKLQGVNPGWDVESVNNDDDAVSLFAKGNYHCVILAAAYNQPANLELIRRLHEASSQGAIPVIVICDTKNDGCRISALRAGAVSVITWASLSSEYLGSTLDLATRNWRLMRVVDLQNQQMLEELANRNNQRKYTEMFAHELLTPLASVQEFVSLVFDGVAGPVNAEQAGHLAYARGGCATIKNSIDALVAAAETSSAAVPVGGENAPDLASLAAISSGSTAKHQQ